MTIISISLLAESGPRFHYLEQLAIEKKQSSTFSAYSTKNNFKMAYKNLKFIPFG